MAQLGKGKLNYRCPSCFLRDLDIDMFYNKETGIYSCIRCQWRGDEKKCSNGTKWSACATPICTKDSRSLILIKELL